MPDIDIEKQQHIERLSTFKQANSGMIAANDMAFNTYGFGTRICRNHERTREEIDQILSTGGVEALRDLSREYFEKDGFYRRILIHYATILQYSGILVPKYGMLNSKKRQQKNIQKAYNQAMMYCDNSNFKSLFTNCSLRALVDGIYCGFIIPNAENKMVVMDLPAAFCRTRYKDIYGDDILEFNLCYFDTIVLKEDREKAFQVFPDDAVRAYRKLQRGNLKSIWYQFPSGVGICFNLFGGKPPFIDVIPASIDYDDAIDTEKERDIEEIKKILVQKVPHDNQNNFLLEPDEVEELHSGAVGMMRHNKNVSVLTTYADVDAIVSKTSRDNSESTLNSMRMNIYARGGTTEQIFASDSNMAIEYSLLNDTAYMMVLANKYSAFISNLLNLKFSNKNINFKYQFLPITHYNIDKYITNTLKMGTSGYSFILPALAYGMSQSDLTDIKTLENDMLKLNELLLPLESSYTQTEKGEVGAPKKDNTEKSDKTIANEKALDNQGGN